MSNRSTSDAVGKMLEGLKDVGEAARETGGHAAQAGTNALDQAKDVAQDVKTRAGFVASAIGEKASSVAEAQKSQLADKLEDVAKAMHRSGAQLEGHQDWVAHFVERGAAELGSLATTLRASNLQVLLGDFGSLARRQPALFVGASMMAGFALTRVGRLVVSTQATVATPASVPPSVARIILAAQPGGAMEATRERR